MRTKLKIAQVVAVSIAIHSVTSALADPQESQKPPTPLPKSAQSRAVATDSFSRLNKEWQKTVADRARDLYEMPNGVFVDAYRINRIRDLAASGDGKSINSLEAAALALRDSTRSGTVTFKGVPDYYQFSESDANKMQGWIFFVTVPEVLPKPFFQTYGDKDRCVIIVPPDRGLRVEKVISPTEFLGQMIFPLHRQPRITDRPPPSVYVSGRVDALVDGAFLKGDFFLEPNGTYSCKDIGSTVTAYKLGRFDNPIGKEALASAIEAGTIMLTQYEAGASSGDGGAITYTVSVLPVSLRFKPKPVVPAKSLDDKQSVPNKKAAEPR